MDQIQEAHEQVSWCLILIDCLLKNVLVNQYIAINMVPPIIQGGQSLDWRPQSGVLIAWIWLHEFEFDCNCWCSF